MSVTIMEFPVIRMNDSHIRQFDSEKELRVMWQKYLKQQTDNTGTFFIDVKGNRYEQVGVSKIRKTINPLRWFGPAGAAIIVDVQVKKTTKLNIDEIKNLLINIIVKHHWYRRGGQNEQQFRDMINNSKTTKELFEKISFYGKWQG